MLSGWGDAAGLRHSPRLLGRPESTDFIGCFPLRSLRCQQQKNKIVAIVPSKSNNKSNTHWILYGLRRTKNAAAIIIRQIRRQPPLQLPPLLALCRWKPERRLKTLSDTREASNSGKRKGSRGTAQTIDNVIVRYNVWLSRAASFIYLFLTRGRESQQIHPSISNLLQSALPKRMLL